MNTKEYCDRLTQGVCDLLGLTLTDVVSVQSDLAYRYLQKLVYAGWLIDNDEAQLMAHLPEFWAWWHQRWANNDKRLLGNMTKLAVLEYEAQGMNMLDFYTGNCATLACLSSYPNDVLMQAFEAEKQAQVAAITELTTLI